MKPKQTTDFPQRDWPPAAPGKPITLHLSGTPVVTQPSGELATNERGATSTCRSIDWYSEGESRTVEIGGVQITVRFIGRKGRRGRIAIEAPAGVVFTELDTSKSKEGRRIGPPPIELRE